MAGRILVLDDEENYAKMLQDLLLEKNYRVDMATRPERAIQQLEEIPYDLVISDYKMPVMDGADFLKRSRELYPNLPFILVSGLMNTPDLVKVANMSVTLVMEKPLDTEAFLEQVSRFSSPLTEIEKEKLSRGSFSGKDLKLDYPEEPRLFSASSVAAKLAIQEAWAHAREGNDFFVLESPGGDAKLMLQDISHWRGNEDRPLHIFDLPDSDEAAIEELRVVVDSSEKSQLVVIRLNSLAQIESAQSLSKSIRSEISDVDALLIVYLLSSDDAPVAFEEATERRGVAVPPIAQRPSDLAVYVRRIARISAERSGRSDLGIFTEEAVFGLLSYGWPGNFKELQEVVQKVVAASHSGSVSLKDLSNVTGHQMPSVEVHDRLSSLMKGEQRCYLEREQKLHGRSVKDLVECYELDSSIQTEEDLAKLPLLDPELGAI